MLPQHAGKDYVLEEDLRVAELACSCAEVVVFVFY